MSVDVRLLGPLTVAHRGEAVDLAGGRTGRLAAMLLLQANHAVSIDGLVDVLWEEPPSSARQQIHNAVRKLRVRVAAFDGFEVVTTPIGYRVEVAADRIDLNRFRAAVREADYAAGTGNAAEERERLSEAAAQWRGGALAGFGGQFFANVRARLDEERLVVTERLLALRVRGGEAGAAIGELIGLVHQHPLRQSPRASLMAALHETGRRVEALETFEELRLLLADEFGLDPSEELQDLQGAILRGLPLYESPAGIAVAAPASLAPPAVLAASAAPAVPSGPAAPAASVLPYLASRTLAPAQTVAAIDPGTRRFLPHFPRDFSGRVPELAMLATGSLSIPGAPLVISALNGMAGVGKTTLALRLASDVAPEYPDGRYFVDLHGFSAAADPLTASAALGILLRQLGIPVDLIPADFEGRRVLWRSQMVAQRAIVLLDNVFDEDQIRPLLPGGSHSVVLITSRRKLVALEGAASFSVDVMSEADAVALFTAIVGPNRCPADETGIAQVVRLCGYLPLAVRIAAARFRDRTSWTIPYLVRQLGDRQLRGELLDAGARSVAKTLDTSFGRLSPEARRFLLVLSRSSGPYVTAATASALSGVPLGRARVLLSALFDDNLLVEDQPGLYRFHELVRDFAVSLVGAEEPAPEREVAMF